MKDQYARDEIARLNARREAEIKLLFARLDGLQAAYDALFDIVAADLGYEADAPACYVGMGMSLKCSPTSPRQFAKTKPKSELVRVPARFKKG